jgi:pantetheine-phosphate adenylyltransferase
MNFVRRFKTHKDMKEYKEFLVKELTEHPEVSKQIDEIFSKWQEPQRFYHTLENHLFPLIDDIKQAKKEYKLTDEQYQKLLAAALFHDIVYNPKSSSGNERKSIEYYEELVLEEDKEVCKIIEETETHKPTTKLSEIFCQQDMNIINQDFNKLMEWENQIFKEFQFVGYDKYKEGRIKFLESLFDSPFLDSSNKPNILNLIKYVEKRKPKIGIYAGSFNKMHKGHLNVLRKSEKNFEKVIIAKGINTDKTYNEEESLKEYNRICEKLVYNEVITYSGLLTDEIKKLSEHYDVTLIRGLRNGNDLDYENTFVSYLKDIYPELKVVYIPCDNEYTYISSSSIRSLEKFDTELVKKYLI